jgi:hypothetical protein
MALTNNGRESGSSVDDGRLDILTGVGQLWHGDQFVADVRYDLRQSTDPEDPVSIRGQVFGIAEEQIRRLFGRRLTLHLNSGEAGNCFFANATGEIIFTTHGLQS